MHDYITAVRPAQYFVHLNSCITRNLATPMTFDAPPEWRAHSGKTISLILIITQITVDFKMRHIKFSTNALKFNTILCNKSINIFLH